MRGIVALAAALATLASAPDASLGGPGVGPTPDAIVATNGGAWQTTHTFEFAWESNRPDAAHPVAAEYVLRNPDGSQAQHLEVSWAPDTRLRIHTPTQPGRYTAEIRLSDGARWGDWGRFELPFDITVPEPAAILAPGAWVTADRASLRVVPPEQSPPSGIRGYALAVDSPPGSTPCEEIELCRQRERPVPDDGELPVPGLSDGIHRLQLATVSGAGVPSAEVTGATLRIDSSPPAVELAGVPGDWARGPVQLRATAVDSLSGMAAAGPAGPFTAIAVDDSPPALGAGAAVATTVAGDGLHSVTYFGRDAAGNVGDGGLGSAPPRGAVVRIDGTPPQVSFAAGIDPADPERIEATVRDGLSGPATRGSIAVRPAGSGQSFEPLPTIAADGRLVAHWDSDAAPVGNYEFRAVAFDRAGNSATGHLRDDGARMVLAAPLKAPVALRFGFGGRRLLLQRCARRGAERRCRGETITALERRPATRSMPYGRRVPVSGLLRRPGGAPLARRQVVLVERMADGERRTTTVVTRDNGRFTTRLAPGPSREVEARFEGDPVLSSTGSRRLRLLVSTAVRMRTSQAAARIGGAPVEFVGRVVAPGRQIPRSGISVELQFRLPGLPWSEFRTVRTDGRGRFVYPYAFSDDDSRGIRFLFRAHVPEQAGWPYAAGNSLPVAVTGR